MQVLNLLSKKCLQGVILSSKATFSAVISVLHWQAGLIIKVDMKNIEAYNILK